MTPLDRNRSSIILRVFQGRIQTSRDRTEPMSVSGLCQICESRPAQERCPNCGTFACEQHFDRGLGLCADCAATARQDERGDDTGIHRS